jgi:hypothetical protein
MQLWIWRNFRLETPADLEMLQFMRDSRTGRCAFADRYQFRLELDWRVVPAPPDFECMLSGYRARLVELGMKNVRNVSNGAWEGVYCEGPEGESTRFGRHFPGESCLLELIFLWPGKRDIREETAVLGSVAEEPAGAGGLRRWRAFGMDLRASPGFVLEQCMVKPARAEMVFTTRAGMLEECFARFGMVEEWLSDPVDSWLMGRSPRNVSAARAGTRQVAGHGVTRVCGTRRAAGVRGLMGRRSRYEAEAWICPSDGRLYSVSRLCDGEPGKADLPPAGRRLTCCDTLEKAGGLA